MGKKKPLRTFLEESNFLTNDIPLSKIVETHFHLDMIKKVSEEVVDDFHKVGISKAISISTSSKNWEIVASLSEQFPSLGFTLGTHPHEADNFNRDSFEQLWTKRSKDKKLQAIGEIGLDYYYNLSSKKTSSIVLSTI